MLLKIIYYDFIVLAKYTESVTQKKGGKPPFLAPKRLFLTKMPLAKLSLCPINFSFRNRDDGYLGLQFVWKIK
jgi:hypothetical protein